MAKSLLIIDTPILCADCPASKLVVIDHAPHFMCGVTGKLVPHDIKVSGFRKGFCPLKTLPRKIKSASEYGNDNEYIMHLINWKKQIDDILGEEDEI